MNNHLSPRSNINNEQPPLTSVQYKQNEQPPLTRVQYKQTEQPQTIEHKNDHNRYKQSIKMTTTIQI